jgi:pyrroline-5-carboxylate reductase
MSTQKTFAILGAGTMGQAVAKGLIERGGVAADRVRATVRHPERAAALSGLLGIPVGTDNAAAARGADVVVIATKPKDVPTVLGELSASGALDHKPLVVSIAAGVRLTRLVSLVPDGTPVVRAMPNTPCLVGQGMIVVSAARSADPDHVELAMAMFRPLGRVLALDDEHMDTVTGLSGSGPAFVYVVIEALSEGGVMMGLPRAVATELAAQTVAGAAAMVLETGRHPAALKDDVTTPAGCTIAGLLTMEDGKIRSVLARTVETAAHAAAGLGKPKA